MNAQKKVPEIVSDRLLNTGPNAGSEGDALVGLKQDRPIIWSVYERKKKEKRGENEGTADVAVS